MKKINILILFLLLNTHAQDTLYQDENFYFASDTSYILLSENIEKEVKKVILKDTLNNLALTFTTYLTGNLDSLVNKNFNPSASMEGVIDSISKDSLGIMYFAKYFRSPITINAENKEYVHFSMGKKYKEKIILYVNAAYSDSVGQNYMYQFYNFGFKDYEKPDTITRIKNHWKPTNNMLSIFDGWAYNVKGVKMYRKEGE